MSSLLYYNKYRDISNRDRYVGLSIDIKTANVKAKKKFNESEFDDIPVNNMDGLSRTGSDTEPCHLTFFPMGGSYILFAKTEMLDFKEDMHDHILGMLKKCPITKLLSILSYIGLSEDLNKVPSNKKKPNGTFNILSSRFRVHRKISVRISVLYQCI